MNQEKMNPETEKRVESILAGNVNPPNEVASYMVSSFQEASKERQQVVQTLQQGERQMTQIRARLSELNGIAAKAYRDLGALLEHEAKRQLTLNEVSKEAKADDGGKKVKPAG